jgi:cytochrome c oxidase subunit II
LCHRPECPKYISRWAKRATLPRISTRSKLAVRIKKVSPSLLLIVVAACSGRQSTLDPGGPSAASIARLGIVMYVVAALVVLCVIVMAVAPFVRPGSGPVNRKLFLWGGGVALPFITLLILVPYVFTVGHEIRSPIGAHRLSVDVTGHQFWWEVAYTRGPEFAVTSANELRIPVGEPVEIFLRSPDVIHSFWIPSLAGKTDMVPGRVNRIVIEATRPGVYRGQCAEYCGKQHALMAFDAVAVPRGEFDIWLARLSRPTLQPASPELREGHDLFVSLGCASCHTVRGVSSGHTGPDLTQVGARRSIGAGTLPGGVGNIAAWVASSQHLKPGNAMPSYNQLTGAQLRAIAAYLESLK